MGLKLLTIRVKSQILSKFPNFQLLLIMYLHKITFFGGNSNYPVYFAIQKNSSTKLWIDNFEFSENWIFAHNLRLSDSVRSWIVRVVFSLFSLVYRPQKRGWDREVKWRPPPRLHSLHRFRGVHRSKLNLLLFYRIS